MDATENHDEASTHLSLSPPHASAPLSSPLSPNRTMTTPANARWVPTREQLVVLEGLYNQGMRSPTFEEILQVTARLKEHGPIEAKNVFYWFQNQKVRQFHRPQPLPMAHRAPGHPFSPVQLQAPSAPNTPACNREAMYMHQTCYPAAQAAANAAYYMQAYGNIQTQSSSAMYYQAVDQNNANTQQPRALSFPHANNSYVASNTYYRHPVTLNLFPQYPTFANRQKERHTGSSAGSARPSTSGSLSCHVESPEVPAAMPQSHSMTSLMKATEDKH